VLAIHRNDKVIMIRVEAECTERLLTAIQRTL
jgi:hypothetical protein